jgi:GH35 family endo-1,4-beta-xylanase
VARQFSFGFLCFLLAYPASGQSNLAQNPGFESGTSGWFAFGPVSISAPTGQSHSGTHACLVQNRTDTWNGVAQSMLGVLQNANTYRVTAWVKLANSNSQPVKLTLQQTDAAGTTYLTVASGTASSTDWIQLSGGVTVNLSGSATALNLYLEGPAAGVGYYADDFDIELYDWKTQANARIEQIRKRDVQLRVSDPSGNPLPGVIVNARQRRHQFAFGSAINGNISNPAYSSFFRTNFEWAVMENESKWYYNEPTQGAVTYAVADSLANFCRTNAITLRGHSIFWAVDQYVQTWVQNLSNSNLVAALQSRLNSAVGHFRGTFMHWDVNNEMLHGNYYGNRLGNSINPWMFQQAHLLDSNAVLFVNDYNVVEGTETDAYKQQIQQLIAAGAPVSGIGAQGHFGGTISPSLTESRLDSLAEMGLPIWISEYDSLNADASVRADNLEILYRTAFSKPYVGGVLMWGFWAGSHWRGSNAAIVDLNWTINAAGQRYQSLLAEWTSLTNGVTGSNGFTFRGFHGDYDVTLQMPGGQPSLRRFTLSPGTGTNVVNLVLNPVNGQPVFHGMAYDGSSRQFRFLITGDAGHTLELQSATNLSSIVTSTWSMVAHLTNLSGTLGFTNSSPASLPGIFYRARQLP